MNATKGALFWIISEFFGIMPNISMAVKIFKLNMIKKISLVSLAVFGILFFSGCSLANSLGGSSTTSGPMSNATVLKSLDGGASWQVKNKVDDKKTIAGINVLTMAMSPADSSVIYLGTESNGLFVTKDGGETWQQVPFADKAYGVVFNFQNPDIMYASGILNGRAKIFKRLKEGEEWKEVYTEPSDGTIISALAIDQRNSSILYAGTNEGVIVKSTDEGRTWVNLKKAEGPIVSIGLDRANSSNVYFGVFQIGVLESRNGGSSIEDITRKIDPSGKASTFYTLVTDPYLSGVLYVGTGSGIFKGSNGGDTWSALNLIESSKAFPIRSIAINPKKSSEIIYSSAKAIYKSVDGGAKWSTIQLDTAKDISVLRYDQNDSLKIFAGFRSF
jgi:photosystem II stability/assembly factor-like uncharacterized protein